ncbi:MAG TPA: methyltransferase domain-containing protein [Beutenbergiaceae bacterium]|nr:methyltransferase domain-containing protein [Beutenbergiaceae bacterium]
MNVQAQITHYWNRRARAYDAHQQRSDRLDADQAVWTRVLDQALAETATDVLDLGTGSGYLAFLLADLGYTVTATDLSQGMLDVAEGHAQHRAASSQPNPTFQLGDAITPAFEPGTFDAVTNRYVMWTLRDPLTALFNWKRVLRPGGQLIIIDAPWFPNGIEANSTEGFVEHYGGPVAESLPLAQARSIEDTLAIIRQAGFQHVTAAPLTEVFTLDQAAGVAPGHHVQMQHIITATKAPTIAAGTDHANIAEAAVARMDPRLDLWTNAFAVCADPTRLKLLIALHAAPEATVSQLATAVESTPNAVTQALRKLHDADVVEPRTHGRHRRWRLIDTRIHELLHHVAAPHSDLHPVHP